MCHSSVYSSRVLCVLLVVVVVVVIRLVRSVPTLINSLYPCSFLLRLNSRLMEMLLDNLEQGLYSNSNDYQLIALN